jgi:hypothetical protein
MENFSEFQSKQKLVPLFPLGIIVLPGEKRYLHIFEKRYKNLFKDAELQGGYFGIPYVKSGNMLKTGSLVKVEKIISKYPNGEIDIVIKGIDIFETEEFYDEHPQRLYPYGKIKLSNRKRFKPSKTLQEAFAKYNKLVLKNESDISLDNDIYSITNSIGLSDIEKYDLILCSSEQAINKIMTNYINLRTLLALQQNSLQEYYCLN